MKTLLVLLCGFSGLAFADAPTYTLNCYNAGALIFHSATVYNWQGSQDGNGQNLSIWTTPGNHNPDTQIFGAQIACVGTLNKGGN